MERILRIIEKEFRQFRRDPKMFAIILVAPIMQLIFLGYAATFDVKNVAITVYDMDRTVSSRNLTERFLSSDLFSVKNQYQSYAEIEHALDKGKLLAAVIIPEKFEERIRRGEQVPVQVLVNGSDGNTALIGSGYIGAVITGFAQNLQAEMLASRNRSLPIFYGITLEPRVWYNPYLLTRYFMVPAIVAMLVSIITLLLTSLAIVKEKETGTLEQIAVTPIQPAELIIGKLVPFVILAFVAVTLALTAMNVIFGISVRGSLPLLMFSSFLYILSTLGLGLFISAVSGTQQQAMMIAIFGVLMPMVYLSGFAFPVENMPKIIQGISYFIPLRYFLTIIRGVILKGNTFADLYFEVGMLLLMGVAILIFSASIFKKKV